MIKRRHECRGNVAVKKCCGGKGGCERMLWWERWLCKNTVVGRGLWKNAVVEKVVAEE